MKQRIDVYICSKPLQYFNVKNIGNVVDAGGKRILIVVDAFQKAQEYVEKIRLFDGSWDEVVYVKNTHDSYLWLLKHPVHNLFIDNDLSWFVFFLAFSHRIHKLYVYEEGIGSYNNASEYEVANYNRGGLLRKITRWALGMGFHFGDSRYCEGVFLTKPDLYNKKFNSNKGRPFEVGFLENLQRNEELFLKITGGLPQELDISGENILIYVTEWEIQNDIIAKLHEESVHYDKCFIKPHPQIRDFSIGESKNVIILKTPIMMELILSYLLKRNNKITIWHQYSTSVVHFLDHIESVPFPINPEYERVYNEYINA